MNSQKANICISIDSRLLEKLRQQAKQEDRSLSQYINLILRCFLESMETNETE